MLDNKYVHDSYPESQTNVLKFHGSQMSNLSETIVIL